MSSSINSVASSAQIAVSFGFAVADSSVVMGDARRVEKDQRLVGRASASRKEYRENYVQLPPGCVVPHHVNRAGISCNSSRITDLTGNIANSGFDPNDASLDAVCIAQPPSLEKRGIPGPLREKHQIGSRHGSQFCGARASPIWFHRFITRELLPPQR